MTDLITGSPNTFSFKTDIVLHPKMEAFSHAYCINLCLNELELNCRAIQYDSIERKW